eukprot:3481636-Pyramimonas_sp.AAC.1
MLVAYAPSRASFLTLPACPSAWPGLPQSVLTTAARTAAAHERGEVPLRAEEAALLSRLFQGGGDGAGEDTESARLLALWNDAVQL